MRRIHLLLLQLLWSATAFGQNIAQIEYFIDSDPGYGRATQVSGFSPAAQVSNFGFNIPVTSLGSGFHRMFVRAKDVNNRWSIVSNHLFYKEVLAAVLPNIVRIEYFIDNDPGYGAATVVSITEAASVNNQSFAIPVNGVSEGIHSLFVRAKDADNKWSVISNHLFYKELLPSSLPGIVKVEYFIDTDPGYGSATDVPVTAGTVSDKEFTIPVNLLSKGIHRLFVRAKDANGKWSLVSNYLFFKDFLSNPLPNITKVEYFIDTDPGYGKAVNVPVTAGISANNVAFSVPVTSLPDGVHKLFIRSKNASEVWSVVSAIEFKTTPSLPVALLSFVIQKQEDKAALGWKTSEETNSDYFQIQHGSDAKVWNEIGRVASSGDSHVSKRYSFLHQSPAEGENLYRLKMVDKDGSFAFSKIISVNFDKDHSIILYPNPASDQVKITGEMQIDGYKLLNSDGELVREHWQKQINREVSVNLKGVRAGVHILQLFLNNGKIESRKLTVE